MSNWHNIAQEECDGPANHWNLYHCEDGRAVKIYRRHGDPIAYEPGAMDGPKFVPASSVDVDDVPVDLSFAKRNPSRRWWGSQAAVTSEVRR